MLIIHNNCSVYFVYWSEAAIFVIEKKPLGRFLRRPLALNAKNKRYFEMPNFYRKSYFHKTKVF